MSHISYSGKVVLAGAGPGDPELITVKALRYLQKADVVIVDRLVGEALINGHVKPGAEVIFVGKQDGKTASTPQEVINELLVYHARHMNLVVRLKGGDVSFFSNMLDELQTLWEHHIPFEIVPGVTSASGAAAYAGFPLTARGLAPAVRFLAHHPTAIWSESYWANLAATDDTLVFYMSSGALDTVVFKLLSHGIGEDKYLAIIEEATTQSQNVQILKLREYTEAPRPAKLISPTLIIIGRVAVLHKKFHWFENERNTQSYFRPLFETIEQTIAR